MNLFRQYILLKVSYIFVQLESIMPFTFTKMRFKIRGENRIENISFKHNILYLSLEHQCTGCLPMEKEEDTKTKREVEKNTN